MLPTVTLLFQANSSSEGGCSQTEPQALGIPSRAPKHHPTTHFDMASGTEDLGNSITQMPLLNKAKQPVAFLYPLPWQLLYHLFSNALLELIMNNQSIQWLQLFSDISEAPFGNCSTTVKTQSTGAGSLQSTGMGYSQN